MYFWDKLQVFSHVTRAFDTSIKRYAKIFLAFIYFILKRGYYSEAFFCTDKILMIPKFRFKFIIYIHISLQLEKNDFMYFPFFF